MTCQVEDATERRLELKVGFIRRIKVEFNSHLVIFCHSILNIFKLHKFVLEKDKIYSKQHLPRKSKILTKIGSVFKIV